MKAAPPRQRRSERLLAEARVAHDYLDLAVEARDEWTGMLNLQKALLSFGKVSNGIARGRLDPTLEDRILAARQGLHERLCNLAHLAARA